MNSFRGLSSHLYFVFFLCAMECCLFLFVLQWHGPSTNYSTNSESVNVNVNLVQSIAINHPHTLSNLRFTTFFFKTLAIVYIRTSLQRTLLYWQHDLSRNLTLIYTKWHKDSFWWHWHVHWHRYLLLSDELRILRKTFDWLLQVIHGVLLFVQIVLRNVLTVLQISRMFREMYQSDRKTVIHYIYTALFSILKDALQSEHKIKSLN